MCGTSSSIAVKVLTHTISDVSHRLMTASVALVARYLHVHRVTKASVAHSASRRERRGAQVLKVSSCCQQPATCTVDAPADGVEAQVVHVRRLAMADDDLHLLKGRVLEHLRTSTVSVAATAEA